ncbi:uncharacterized protein K441DRAFT_562659, partial [Cenococcum geophilum 1.58]|uniref:uncharacterized protein n=1 Tax=Cenococcum geophilum 1.58 TaxID=794803 RepID=UPI00358E129C
GCFIYNYKGPCYIYYKETEEQKEVNKAEIERINKEEIEAECRAAFNTQEKEKEKK